MEKSSDALQKLGVSRKKRPFAIKNATSSSGKHARERLKTKTLEQIIYVDEAGIDNRDDYPYGYCEIGQRFYALKSGKRTLASQYRLPRSNQAHCLRR